MANEIEDYQNCDSVEDPAPDASDSTTSGGADAHRIDFLIADLKAGSSSAYSQLHSLMADRLFRAAFRLLGDRQEAEDAVQEAFLELIRSGCPPSEGQRLEAWLYRSVQFTCADQFRRRSRRPATPTADLPESTRADDLWIGFDPEVENALANLTPTQRLIIQLKHVDGLEGHAIAEIVGSNRVAVYAAAARAERSLRRDLSFSGSLRLAGGDAND